MIYKMESIELRPFDKEMIEVSWFNDPEVTYFNSHGRFPMTKSKALEYYHNIKNSNEIIVWGIFVETKKLELLGSPIRYEDGSPIMIQKHIGNVSLQQIDLINRSAELAIIIGDKKYWRKGVGLEACRTVVHHSFQKLGLNRIYGGTSVLNKGMNKIFEKMNWTKEGVFREAILNNGKLVDVNCWSILKKDWCDPIIL